MEQVTTSPMTAVMNPQNDCRLAKLPNELLDRVTMFLPTTAFTQLRLTCRALEVATKSAFSHAFFRQKQFMLSDFSLSTLVAISRHPVFSKAMVHLVIASDRLDGVLSKDDFPEGRHSTEYNFQAWVQEECITSGKAVRLLIDALNHLPRVHTISVRDYNSPTRFRDGPGARWSSYGAPSLAHSLGLTPSELNPRMARADNFPDSVVGIVFAAAQESTCRPHTFLTTIKTRYRYVRVRKIDPAFRRPDFCDFLAGLTTVHLDLRLPPQEQDLAPCLHRFLAAARNVEWLRLNILPFRLGVVDNSYLEWLAAPVPNVAGDDEHVASNTSSTQAIVSPNPPTLSPLPSPTIQVPPTPSPILLPLKRFELGGDVILSASVLRAIIEKHQSLQHVSLIGVGLNGDDGHTAPVGALWRDLFASLGTRASRASKGLRTLDIRWLKEYVLPSRDSTIYFVMFKDGGVGAEEKVRETRLYEDSPIDWQGLADSIGGREHRRWVSEDESGSSSEDDEEIDDGDVDGDGLSEGSQVSLTPSEQQDVIAMITAP